jgi:hypothetical protein
MPKFQLDSNRISTPFGSQKLSYTNVSESFISLLKLIAFAGQLSQGGQH